MGERHFCRDSYRGVEIAQCRGKLFDIGQENLKLMNEFLQEKQGNAGQLSTSAYSP